MAAILNNGGLSKTYKIDKKISYALMTPFVVLTIQYFVLIYFNLIGTSAGSSVQLFSKILVSLVFLHVFPLVLQRSKIIFIEVYFIAIFIFLLNYLIFPENGVYITELIFPFFFVSLPIFLYTLSIKNFLVFKKAMKKASYIIFVVGLLLGVFIFLGRASVGVYSMPLSYYMLLPAIMFMDGLLDEFSFKDLIFTGISLLIILSLGARGPILCILIFVLLKLFKPNSKRTLRRVIVYFSLICLGAFALIFLDEIVRYTYDSLLKIGIRSRTLSLFLRDGIHLSGRDRIYKNIISEIMENPILGIGLAGDRRILYGNNAYVHNIFIELIGNFGLLFGSIVIFIILSLIISSFISKDKQIYELTIIWLSLGFIHLLISSSYIIDIKFWIFMGLTINICLKKHRKVDYDECFL